MRVPTYRITYTRHMIVTAHNDDEAIDRAYERDQEIDSVEEVTLIEQEEMGD